MDQTPAVKEWKPSRTARAVAAERAVLDDLGVIGDPFALRILGGPMRGVAGVARRLPRRTWARSVTLAGLATRVRWFDAEVLDGIAAGAVQVVTVGAGYDARPWRFPRAGVRYFEVDHPATQADKRRCAPDDGPTYVAADLLGDDMATELLRAGLDPAAPSVVVVEGVTMYLDEDVVRRQLAALRSVSAPSSRLAVDFYPASRPALGTHRRQLLLQRVARIGSSEGFRLGVDSSEAGALVADSGWDPVRVVTDREAATSMGPPDAGLPTTSLSGKKTYVAAIAG